MIEGKSGTRELIAYFCSGVNSASPKQPVRCTHLRWTTEQFHRYSVIGPIMKNRSVRKR